MEKIKRDLLGGIIYPVTDQTEVGNQSFSPPVPPRKPSQQTESEKKTKSEK